MIDDKSPATVEDEDRLVASAPTFFIAFHWAPIFLLGIVFLTKCIPKREYYVAGVVTIFMIIPGFLLTGYALFLESDSGS